VSHPHPRQAGHVVVEQVDVEVIDAWMVGGMGGDRDGVMVRREAQIHTGPQHTLRCPAATTEEVGRADRESQTHNPQSTTQRLDSQDVVS
jgi:hypothetical protein